MKMKKQEYDFSLFKFWLLPPKRVCSTAGETRGRKRNLSLAERDSKISELYRHGIVREEIGRMYGISGQRVSQILNGMCIKSKDGGSTIRALVSLRYKKKSDSYQSFHITYGCSREDVMSLNNKLIPGDKGSWAAMYSTQRNNAISHRGIEWKFTFPQWLKIWKDSGHLHERGRIKGKYVMSRICDLGAYEENNIKIIPFGENSIEAREMDKVRKHKQMQKVLVEI